MGNPEKHSDAQTVTRTAAIRPAGIEYHKLNSEERLPYILYISGFGYFEDDLKGNLTAFNDIFPPFLGYTEKELLGMNYRKYTTPESAQILFTAFSRVYQTGRPECGIEYVVIDKAGNHHNVSCSCSLIQDETGTPIGFRGITQEITQRKEAEEKLRHSEQRYRNILDCIEDAYYELDLNGRLTFFNDAICKLHGYTAEELKMISFKKYVVEEDWPKVIQAHLDVYNTGRPIVNFQIKTVSKNKRLHYIESSISLMRDENDQPIGYRGITRDVTVRKNVELELKEAKEVAEAATKAKSDFLANMSHEIRTPMNGVIGMYNLLLNTDLTPEQADYVQTGKRSADGLLVIINDILDFSKIEAGKLDLDIMDFDLRKAMQEAVELPAIQAHQKGLEFAYDIHADIPSDLRGDPGRLKQIITNLCNNALKFTEKGEIVIRVTPQTETDTHITLRFTVKDTGIGISQADQKRLFTSFQQLDTSTTRKYGGTGLGLAICKKLAELMRGGIGVSSEADTGSTFWFEILFEKQPHAGKPYFLLPEIIRNKRILLVDDNKTNRDILKGYLAAWGCVCEAAKDAEVALTLMRAMAKVKAPFDLVITDLYMPVMDGAELGRQIKSDPDLRDTPLVMLTSQGVRGAASEMKEIGFSAYLTKPIRRSQLFDSLSMVLGHSSKPVQAEAGPISMITRHSVIEAKRKNIRILLAEDNIVNRKLALRLLEKFGFQTDTVVNGKEAVAALESTPYDLVFMDVQMPEMDGLEATRVIRDPQSTVLNHAIPIIAMTAHAMKGDRELCIKAGMDDYVSKPIEPNLLFAAIERQLQKMDRGDEISKLIV